MDTSSNTGGAGRRTRRPADGAPARTRARRCVPGPSANDAVWWVVLYQGAVDYTQSIGAADQDAEAATRLVGSYQAHRRP